MIENVKFGTVMFGKLCHARLGRGAVSVTNHVRSMTIGGGGGPKYPEKV